MMSKKIILALCGSLLVGSLGLAAAQPSAATSPAQTSSEKSKLLDKYDTNRDGKLSPEERAAMRADFAAKRAAKKAELLAKYDANKNGKLDPAELQQMKLDREATQFEKMDTDHNGVVTLGEYQAFKAQQGEHRHARHGHGGKRTRGERKPGAGFGGKR